MEVGTDDQAVLQVAHAQPHRDGLGGEATVGLGQDELAAWSEHAVDLLEDLERPNEVVHRHHAGDHLALGLGIG